MFPRQPVPWEARIAPEKGGGKLGRMTTSYVQFVRIPGSNNLFLCCMETSSKLPTRYMQATQTGYLTRRLCPPEAPIVANTTILSYHSQPVLLLRHSFFFFPLPFFLSLHPSCHLLLSSSFFFFSFLVMQIPRHPIQSSRQ